MKGGLAEKASWIFSSLGDLYERVKDLGAGETLLAVCGDTLSAGLSPFAWYLISGSRSIHIESGLRSMRPLWDWCRTFQDQKLVPWRARATRPFPEGLCTRLATQASQILFAPVQRNHTNLLSEGYDEKQIFVSGSPSVDAVQIAKEHFSPDPVEGPRRLRVDIHRRENLTPERLETIFSGLSMLAKCYPIEFVVTKTMQACKGLSWREEQLCLLRSSGIGVSLQNPSYLEVVRFLCSSKCLALYTDSGGLQEESCILGVPCMTCRFETDRPETVTEFETNLLIPPISPQYIYESIDTCLCLDKTQVWPGLGISQKAYGENVGQKTVAHLDQVELEPSTETTLW
jgi:UDP-N-acetylglucosamine 2-epimerase (non-hydrolysing)